jgi:hypothetical protein
MSKALVTRMEFQRLQRVALSIKVAKCVALI